MQTFNIGRDAGNQVVLNDNLVSRHHAQLTLLDNGQVMIKDLGSSNGTFVNGNRITECYLNTGDIVKCGSVFLNWSQYTNFGGSPGQPINYQQPVFNQPVYQEAVLNSSANEYSFGDVFKYLATRILEIGDLFKTNWDKRSVVLFLKGVPVILTFIISIIVCSRLSIRFYFSPTVLAVFLFAICPFISMYLLSLNEKVEIDKVALASGILGFLQFSGILCFVAYRWIYYSYLFSNHSGSNDGFDFFLITTTLLLIIFLVNLTLAFYLFLYKYFISIGITRSKSIYLIITTIGVNLFFQILSSYIIFLIIKENFGVISF